MANTAKSPECQTIPFRGSIERHDTSSPKALTDLAHWLIDDTAWLDSVNRLTGHLESVGHKVPKATVSEYSEWFEDTDFHFTVGMFDASLARSNVNSKRICCIDHALVTSVPSGALVDSGRLLENIVFIALRRRYPQTYCYDKTKTGGGVDLIVPMRGRSRVLVQACDSPAGPETR